ncbi:DUF309 domain-containing protein [Halorussus marinus]|uniref:DUF309 domain-containing protein n=1 Tax=Halorussus marinus TaxID=2505976 RepID=UPI001091FA98|nr:DUF309 domain-containing protein [Halorussus marinus]
MDDHLRAGIAVYNAGEHHAAHDAWEDHWLGLDAGTDDERFLHGLIQFTAAVHHAHGANWVGVQGLAESAAAYLADLPANYRGVNVAAVRRCLRALAADPEHVERAAPPRLRADGLALVPEDLEFDAAAIAAVTLAEEYGYDEAVIERGVDYAREDLADGQANSSFVTFVMDFARDAANRGIVFRRLRQHVAERRRRETDVEGLFE